MTRFADLGLAEPILRAFQHEGYDAPTPIQAKAIPPLLEGRDLLGIAQTGTGKTAAFAAPILHALVNERVRPAPKTVRALILAPTRELAAQIADSFRAYGRFARLSVATVFGGVSPGPQIQAIARGLDVLVATPGRLIDHLESGHIDLSQTKIVVLDEADHMLDLGFVLPIRRIVSKLPKERQNLFFSATMPREIAKLAGEMLRNPVEVSVAPVATTAERVAQGVYLVEPSQKRNLLVEILGNPELERVIVFTRTKRGADRVAETLEASGINADAIHGNKSQNQRTRALESFRAGRTRVLVATDIAARGIDIDNVSHVVNFELPEVPEAYVHRIGRTARAGREGQAISFCDHTERDLLRQIERTTRQSLSVVDRRGDKAPKPAPVVERPAVQARPERAHQKPRFGDKTRHHAGKARQGERSFEPRQEARPDARADARPDNRMAARPSFDKPRGEDRPAGEKRDGLAPRRNGPARPPRRFGQRPAGSGARTAS